MACGFWAAAPFAGCRNSPSAWLWECGPADRKIASNGILLGGFGLVTGVLLYPAALQLYHGLVAYIFVDLATGACCFLVLAGMAGIIARFPYPAKVFGLVGAFSYGIYLVHQPYVIWLGLRIRELPIWVFLLIVVATLTVMSAWGITLEKATNALVNKLTAKPQPPPTL